MNRSRGFVIRARKVYLNRLKKEKTVFINIGTGTERISALSLRISERSGEKIALYERMLKEKDEMMVRLEKLINR